MLAHCLHVSLARRILAPCFCRLVDLKRTLATAPRRLHTVTVTSSESSTFFRILNTGPSPSPRPEPFEKSPGGIAMFVCIGAVVVMAAGFAVWKFYYVPRHRDVNVRAWPLRSLCRTHHRAHATAAAATTITITSRVPVVYNDAHNATRGA